VQFTNNGSATTLQVLTVNQGAYNANSYMLMPVSTNEIAGGPTITNEFPNGVLQFQATNYGSVAEFVGEKGCSSEVTGRRSTATGHEL
jgi:hypothetical protein